MLAEFAKQGSEEDGALSSGRENGCFVGKGSGGDTQPRGPRCLPPPQAVERVLYPHLSTYWTNLQAVLDDYSVSNAQVKADGHKVYGAILVSAGPPTRERASSAALDGRRPGPHPA